MIDCKYTSNYKTLNKPFRVIFYPFQKTIPNLALTEIHTKKHKAKFWKPMWKTLNSATFPPVIPWKTLVRLKLHLIIGNAHTQPLNIQDRYTVIYLCTLYKGGRYNNTWNNPPPPKKNQVRVRLNLLNHLVIDNFFHQRKKWRKRISTTLKTTYLFCASSFKPDKSSCFISPCF